MPRGWLQEGADRSREPQPRHRLDAGRPHCGGSGPSCAVGWLSRWVLGSPSAEFLRVSGAFLQIKMRSWFFWLRVILKTGPRPRSKNKEGVLAEGGRNACAHPAGSGGSVQQPASMQLLTGSAPQAGSSSELGGPRGITCTENSPKLWMDLLHMLPPFYR